MADYAEIEIGIHCHERPGYLVDVRFDNPQSDTTRIAKSSDVVFEPEFLATLQANESDPLVYGQLLTQELFSNATVREEFLQALASTQSLEKKRGATWFELSHDRMINPIKQNNHVWFEQNLSMLQRQVALWDTNHRLDGLLLTGTALDEAEAWAKKHIDELTPIEQNFLEECRKERSIAQQIERKNLRIRRLAIISSVVSVIAIVLLIISIISVVRTTKEVLKTNAQRLAFAAPRKTTPFVFGMLQEICSQ